jgi:3-oxoacyl-[acyl-carrier-protein] synthase-3
MMRKAGISGVGKYLPQKVLANADLEKIVDTSDEWITTRTGIKERRLAAGTEAASDLASAAARQAISRAGVKPEEIGLVIVATITPDLPFPATACLVQDALGIKHAACFDISAACAGFVYALSVAGQFISSGAYKHALVVGAEKLSAVTDWQDRNTCVLFGDGAGAAVVSAVKRGGIISSYLGCDGSRKDLLFIPAGGSRLPASPQSLQARQHYIKMQGNELFKLAVRAMTEAAQKVLRQARLKFSDVDLVIPHQANARIIMAVAKKLGLAEEKIYLNIERYGNMSSASTAIALCEALEQGRIKKGDLVLLDTFGAGLVWGACLIEW